MGAEAGRAAGRSGGPEPLLLRSESLTRRFRVSSDVNPMDQPGEAEQPPQQQPWGRLLRLGAGEGEPHVLLRKREWTIGRRRGAGRGAGMRAGAGGPGSGAEDRGLGSRAGRPGSGAGPGCTPGRRRPWAGPAVLSSFSGGIGSRVRAAVYSLTGGPVPSRGFLQII